MASQALLLTKMDPETAVINGIKPLQLIAPGAKIEVPGSGKKPYEIKRCIDVG